VAVVANQVDMPSWRVLVFICESRLIMYQEWFKVSEVAEISNLSQKTIRNYINLGFLKAHHRGPRNIVIHIDDIDKMYRPFGKSYKREYRR